MQFAVTAYDHTDPEAFNRRLASRQAHLEGIKLMAQEGTFISGGAILNDEGRMIGSTVHVEFENREALDLWLKNDPYMTGNVWEKIDIREIKLVDIRR
jgi:uncharacterized protein YciI